MINKILEVFDENLENKLIPQSIFSSKITIVEKCYNDISSNENSCSYENVYPVNKFVVYDNDEVLNINSKISKKSQKDFTILENEKLNLKNDLK